MAMSQSKSLHGLPAGAVVSYSPSRERAVPWLYYYHTCLSPTSYYCLDVEDATGLSKRPLVHQLASCFRRCSARIAVLDWP